MDRFVLKFFWLDTTIAVCLNQKVDHHTIPLTEYFFWPQTDSWSSMKTFVENESGWISENESSLLLNRVTEVINFWQEKESSREKDIDKVQDKFPDCVFLSR